MHPSYNHVTIGPGGIKCSCCHPVGGKQKKVKQYMNRATRRSLKNKLRKEEE
jgi:hypothetical protein